VGGRGKIGRARAEQDAGIEGARIVAGEHASEFEVGDRGLKMNNQPGL
jgi:hypothetical protein